MDAWVITQSALYFLALINPASKVFLLCSMEPRPARRDLWGLAGRATVAAWSILIVLSALGRFLLHDVFHVELYSLKVAGGVVLFVIGLTAVRKGRFYEGELQGRPNPFDLAVVPIGAPLIAGPGTITVAISFASEHGLALTLVSLTVALAVNFAIMLSALGIGRVLERIHATGPLVRITGLIVAAVAVQMVLTGLGEWLHLVHAPA